MTQIAIFAMFNVNYMNTNRLKGFHDIKGTISTVILLNLSVKIIQTNKNNSLEPIIRLSSWLQCISLPVGAWADPEGG